MQENKNLDEMVEEEYESESLLQELLVYNTGLLAGEQMDTNNPREWLLVSREMKLSFEEGGQKNSSSRSFIFGSRWYPNSRRSKKE